MWTFNMDFEGMRGKGEWLAGALSRRDRIKGGLAA
jgi:hypothetical protein